MTRKDAERYVPSPDGIKRKIKEIYSTDDIVKSVLSCYKKFRKQTSGLAQQLNAGTEYKTCFAIYNFVKSQIKYIEDKVPEQDVKSPSRTIYDGFGDCKSMSILIASLLYNLGIPHKFRFTAYNNNRKFTHVYIITDNLILDAVWHRFNEEKKFTKHKDYKMALNQLSGIGSDDFAKLQIRDDIENLSEGELDLLLEKQAQEIHLKNLNSLGMIGSLSGERTQDTIDALDDLIEAAQNQDENQIDLIAQDIDSGDYASTINSIGSRSSRRKRRKARRKSRRAKVKKVFSKAAKLAKRTAKKFKKAISAPARGIAKLVLTKALPQASMFFLYIFINDKSVIKAMPISERKKRQKAIRLAQFIAKFIGIEKSQFDKLVRNAITKQYKMSPERLIAKSIRPNVGVAPTLVAAIPKILKGINFLINLFKKAKKKVPIGVGENDLPSLEALGNMPNHTAGKITRQEPTSSDFQPRRRGFCNFG